eukprot:TRINITY_DN3998_c0_g1_i13.p1 TRINITY_DN3998_c0_g1~~TRINITY_DN3998_c0_g1_i13.p1  ORF type:complete len:106 (-),score=7.25 TRINITY_DN3998_c0_g1_i13:165-482(-)
MWSTFLKCEVTTVIDPLVILYAPSNLNLYNTSSQSNTYDLSHPSLRPKTSLKLIQSCKTEVAHLIMYPYPHQSSFRLTLIFISAKYQFPKSDGHSCFELTMQKQN